MTSTDASTWELDAAVTALGSPPTVLAVPYDGERRLGGAPVRGTPLPLQLVDVATMRDLDALALALPEVTKELDAEGRPTYLANGKMFCFHRRPRKDAPFDDVLVFRVDGQDAKELTLADPRGLFFTTPHWAGYPAVLLRIPGLRQLSKRELRDLVVDAWLTRAPKRLAKAWLAEHEGVG